MLVGANDDNTVVAIVTACSMSALDFATAPRRTSDVAKFEATSGLGASGQSCAFDTCSTATSRAFVSAVTINFRSR